MADGKVAAKLTAAAGLGGTECCCCLYSCDLPKQVSWQHTVNAAVDCVGVVVSNTVEKVATHQRQLSFASRGRASVA